jgi:dolichol-phosphate mannosyltransferase
MKPALSLQNSWQTPTYETYEFRPRRSRFSVCIPVINEGNRIRRQLERMAALDIPADVIIGDGGSTDGSADPEIMQTLNVRSLLVKTGPGKLSAQLRMLFAYSIQEGYEGIVALDGNGKDGVEAIPSFLGSLEEEYDFVQGSRFLPGGGEFNTPLERKLGAQLIHAPVISLAAGFRYTDTTNGFRAFSSRLLLDERVQPFRDVFDTYNLHYYLSIRAPRLGYRVRELPVTRTYPASGPVPSKISGLSGKLDLLKLLFLSALGHYNPPRV